MTTVTCAAAGGTIRVIRGDGLTAVRAVLHRVGPVDVVDVVGHPVGRGVVVDDVPRRKNQLTTVP
ncbi:MAG: hypothetical protein ACRDTX_14140 [Pseudonocardiaceae bacterium]